ncbi:MAG: hypothetical protein ACOCWG_01010, partial [bacterium]
MNKIYPVYFTCADHFEELMASLRALSIVGSELIKKIFIYCDVNDFFQDYQKEQLTKINNHLDIRKTPASMMWGGIKTIENELYGFSQIKKEIDLNDYIMNVDSDLIMISDNILKQVIDFNGKYDLIGQAVNMYFKAS